MRALEFRLGPRVILLTVVLAALAILMITAACAPAPTSAPLTAAPQVQPTTPPPTAAPEAKELKIGASVSLTGNFAQPGKFVNDGYLLWEEQVNKKGGIKVGNDVYKVKMIIYDDQSDPNTAVRLAEKLITEDKVNFMFGPYGSGMTNAVAAITDKYKVILIAAAGNADTLFEQGYQYFFVLARPAGSLINPFVEMLEQLPTPPSTIALVAKDDIFPQVQHKSLLPFLDEQGKFKVVFDQTYPKDATDFSTLITQLKARNPDVIIQMGHQPDCTVFLSQLKEQRVSPKAYFCSGPDMRDFYKAMGKDAAYSFGYTLGWDPNVKWKDDVFGSASDYIELFRAKYGTEPGYNNVNASGAGVLLQKALEQAGTTDPTVVRDTLRGIEIEIGAGPIKFGDDGRNLLAQAPVQQIQKDGTVVLVWPLDRRTAEPVYPAPSWDQR